MNPSQARNLTREIQAQLIEIRAAMDAAGWPKEKQEGYLAGLFAQAEGDKHE